MDGQYSVTVDPGPAERAVRWRPRLVVATAALGLGAIGFASLLSSGLQEAPAVAPPEQRPRVVLQPARGESVRAPEGNAGRTDGVRAPAPPPSLVSAREPMRRAPLATHELDDELGQPHAITPQHLRIFEENNRIAALNGAMDRGDVVALRRMNAAYRRDYAEDAHFLADGYDLIADCLEQRTAQVVASARRFWERERASSLRRYVRRHCLESERPR
jgi:hypothetical protein